MKRRKTSSGRGGSSLRRQLQSKQLKERVEKGRRNAQGRVSSILDPELITLPLWRPRDGEHIIDIVPYLAGKLDKDVSKGKPTYTYEYFAHPRVGANNALYMCLTEMFNKPCPICEHRLLLREKGADDKIWKELFPKKRNIYHIICYDRGEEQKGVQLWEVPAFYSEKNILAISKKRGRGGKAGRLENFSDVDNGKSISFLIEPPVSKNDFPTYTGFAFEDRDYKIDDELIESCQTTDEIVMIPKYDDLDKIYWGSRDREEDEEEPRRSRRHRSRHKEEEPEEETSFDDMMDELEDLDDLEQLEEFAETYGFDVRITRKSRPRKVKRDLQRLIMEMKDEHEPEEEEEEEEESGDGDITWGDLASMKRRKLLKLIDEEDLDVEPDDADDEDELREMVADELGIEDIPF